MPVAKRWHPVSRDLNSDPEVWQLTSLYGDRALRVWLEILSGADKTTNQIPLSGLWLSSLAHLTRTNLEKVVRIIVWMLDQGWIEVHGAPGSVESWVCTLRNLCVNWPKTRRKLGEDLPQTSRRLPGDHTKTESRLFLCTCKYWRYHKRQEPRGADDGSLPSRSEPSLPKEIKEEEKKLTSSGVEHSNGILTGLPPIPEQRAVIERFTGPLGIPMPKGSR